jgi:hypothetical protein
LIAGTDILAFRFGDHDSLIAVSFGTGALEILRHSALALDEALVHHDPRNFHPEPFREFFQAHGELLKLKALDLHD